MNSLGIDWDTPMHLIDPHLYLGDYSAASLLGEGKLPEPNITTILTVMTGGTLLPKHESITYHQIKVEDDESEDLLTYFVETNELIENCQKSETNILVHCMAGVSRSASVVIAYIMYKYKMSFTSAKSLVMSKRNLIYPNEGFEKQLQLFEKMNFCLDANDRRFRQHLIHCYVNRYSINLDSNVNKYFEILEKVENLTPNLHLGQSYSCSKCGHKLFHQLNVIRNEELTEASGQSCQTVYVEPQKWMTELFHFDQTILYPLAKCKNCSETNAKFHQYLHPFDCNCSEHIRNRCLKIQMLDNSFKLDESNSESMPELLFIDE